MIEPTLLVAFIAGVLSFLSPCVVPLYPLYLSYISGSFSRTDKHLHRPAVLIGSLCFVAGFTFIFVLLGLGASLAGRFLIVNRDIFLRFGGLVIIFFGLHALGLFDAFGLEGKVFSFRIPNRLKNIRLLGPFLLGLTFGFAWTPCIGPVLGTIITLAALSESLQKGVALLFLYALGISLPFFLTTLAIEHSGGFLKNFAPLLPWWRYLAGLLLLFLGLLMASGQYRNLSSPLLINFSRSKLYDIIVNHV